jgi:dipeptidyl aminopeptidase/acylaminoacyl peptidase
MPPHRHRNSKLALLLLFVACAAISPALAAPRTLRDDDLLRLRWVADPQLAPDGSQVAFTLVSIDSAFDEYQTRIAVIPMSGGAPRSLTSGPRDRQPRWSPDGRTVAFVRGIEAKPAQIFLLPMNGGEPSQLTRLQRGAANPVWSPHGDHLVFTSSQNPALDEVPKTPPKHPPARVVTKPVFRGDGEGWIDWTHPDHLWIADVPGGGTRQLTTGSFDEEAPQFSRDGRWILFTSDRRKQPWFEDDHSTLFAVSPGLEKPADGGFTTVWDFAGAVRRFVQAPNGRLATISFANPAHPRSYDENHLLLAAGSWPQRSALDLTAGNSGDVGGALVNSDQYPPRGGGGRPLAFSEDSRSVYTVVGREGSNRFVRIDASSGAVEELTDARYTVIAGTATPDARRWALTLANWESPGDLYTYDTATRGLHKLWGPNDSLLAGIQLATLEEFWYTSFDGRRIQGWIVKPPGFVPSHRYPLVLAIHGGPHTAYGAVFFHEFQVLAASGYLILFTNPRGSSSYGQEFGNLIQYRYPGDDYRDLMAAVDEVVKRPYVDGTRLGVCGGSGGGLLTNWIITQTHRFKAAITDRCVAEWESFVYTTDFTLFRPTWFQKQPYEDPQEYVRRSPVTYVANVDTPLLIVQGDEDLRAPSNQAEAMFRALKELRKPVAMVRVPGEDHDLSRNGTPSHRLQRLHHYHAWFDQFLQGKRTREYDE